MFTGNNVRSAAHSKWKSEKKKEKKPKQQTSMHGVVLNTLVAF